MFALVASSRSAGADAPAVRAIRRSDVVFMYDNPEMYQPYGCTVLGWAGGANQRRIEEAHAAGVRQFSCSVGFLTEGRGVIDFSEDFLDAACRNFAGEPFNVPWLWDHQYKGQPFRWWCTNSPLYREYLAGRLEETMAAGPDGLHIDDYRGTSGSVTWLSGGFCRHCMAGFREYLAKNVSSEKLADLGIADLSSFDYREFLLARGVKPEEYNRRRSSLPLADEFYDFQVKANTAFVAEYRKRANQLRGKPVTLCVNSGLSNPQALAIASELSYFCCEVPHDASRLAPATHPIYIYKLGDGLDRPITSTASGQDWAYVCEHNKPCLVRSWAALSYALGHTLMAPHRQWCYTQEKGTHWYVGPTEEYAPLYRFVRQNARLFDDYEALAPVAVVYDSGAIRRGQGGIEPICVALAERNVPFTVVVAGDDWIDYRLDEDCLDGFKAVILAAKTDGMDDRQKGLLEKVEANGRLVHWGDDARLAQLVPPPVAIEGSDRVMVVPRAIPADGDAPMVVHLLNRHYEGQADRMVPQTDFSLRLRRDLFAGRKPAKATLYALGDEPVELQLHAEDVQIRIEIPKLDLWAILELTD
jgi:hypothetical protein